jgi:hypothetical protein
MSLSRVVRFLARYRAVQSLVCKRWLGAFQKLQGRIVTAASGMCVAREFRTANDLDHEVRVNSKNVHNRQW